MLRSQLPHVAVCALWVVGCAPETVPAPETSTREAPVREAPVNKTSMAAVARGAEEAANVANDDDVDDASAAAAQRSARAQAEKSSAAPAMAPDAGEAGSAAGAASPASTESAPAAMEPESASAPRACTELMACCATRGEDDERDDCQEIVGAAEAERCMRARPAYCDAPMQGEPTSESCGQLSECCATLSDGGDQRDCERTVERDDARRCSRQLSRRCPERAAAPEEPTCLPLVDCCATLTEPDELDACRDALRDDDRRDCERALEMLCE